MENKYFYSTTAISQSPLVVMWTGELLFIREHYEEDGPDEIITLKNSEARELAEWILKEVQDE